MPDDSWQAGEVESTTVRKVSSWVRLFGGVAGLWFLLGAVLPGISSELDGNRSMAFAYSRQAAEDAALPLTARDVKEGQGLAPIPAFPARPSGDAANFVVADQTLASYYDNEASNGQTVVVLIVSGAAASGIIALNGFAGVASGVELRRKLGRRTAQRSVAPSGKAHKDNGSPSQPST